MPLVVNPYFFKGLCYLSEKKHVFCVVVFSFPLFSFFFLIVVMEFFFLFHFFHSFFLIVVMEDI